MNASTNQFGFVKNVWWLVKREIWENKVSLFYSQAAVAGFLLLVFGFITTIKLDAKWTFNGDEINRTETIANALERAKLDGSYAKAIASVGDYATLPPLIIVLGLLSIVTLSYLVSALFEERKDRSILFWKSLPVSDTQTILSKLITALVIAPLASIIIIWISSLVILLMVCLNASRLNIALFNDVLTSASVYTAPLKILALLPVHILWALPVAAWFLLMSSLAKSRPMLWAFIPLIVLVICVKGYFAGQTMLSSNAWLFSDLLTRPFVGLFPGSWFVSLPELRSQLSHAGHNDLFNSILRLSFNALTSWNLWFGALAGVAMTWAAIARRRWNADT
jgi:ABC-2 type transport system permease protein